MLNAPDRRVVTLFFTGVFALFLASSTFSAITVPTCTITHTSAVKCQTRFTYANSVRSGEALMDMATTKRLLPVR